MELRSSRWFKPRTEASAQHRAAMHALGYRPEDYADKPVIAIFNSWNDLNSCNLPHKYLTEAVKRGVVAAGGFPVEFHSISTAADFMMPSDLIYRNLMSIDVEETIRAYPIDGAVLLCECDKTCPAQLMAVASADIPALQLAAGHRMSGWFNGQRITYATDWWRLWDQYQGGQLTQGEWDQVEASISCSLGGCAVMGTASTMKLLSEVLGMMLPGTSSIPASDSRRVAAAEATGRRIVEMVREGLTPSRLMTPDAFDNAIRVLAAVGGSTNAIIHLTAIAGRLGIRLTMNTFQKHFRSTPLIVNIQPSGEANMDDFYHAGGVGAIIHALLPILNDECLTAVGKTLGMVYGSVKSTNNQVIASLDAPISSRPALTVLRGNLAADGAIIKSSACSPHLMKHRGRAVVFDNYADMVERIDLPGVVQDEGDVLILRNSGPVGAPGMPEWGALPIPQSLLKRGVIDMVRVSDARMSGTAFGTIVLHVVPEAAVGGLLAYVKSGDVVSLDIEQGSISLEVSEEVIAQRKRMWRNEIPHYDRGYLRLYQRHVMQATEGCDFDFLSLPPGQHPTLAEPIIGKS